MTNREFKQKVEETGFGRVCPKCSAKWYLEDAWMFDTNFVDSHTETVDGVRRDGVGPGSKYRKASFVLRYKIRQCQCGGEMLDQGCVVNYTFLED